MNKNNFTEGMFFLRSSWWWLGSTFYCLAYVNAYQEWISVLCLLVSWYVAMEGTRMHFRYAWVFYALMEIIVSVIHTQFIFKIPCNKHEKLPWQNQNVDVVILAHFVAIVVMGGMVHGDKIERVNDLILQYSSTIGFNSSSKNCQKFWTRPITIHDVDPTDSEGNHCETYQEGNTLHDFTRECKTPSQSDLSDQYLPGPGHESMRSLRSGRKY